MGVRAQQDIFVFVKAIDTDTYTEFLYITTVITISRFLPAIIPHSPYQLYWVSNNPSQPRPHFFESFLGDTPPHSLGTPSEGHMGSRLVYLSCHAGHIQFTLVFKVHQDQLLIKSNKMQLVQREP